MPTRYDFPSSANTPASSGAAPREPDVMAHTWWVSAVWAGIAAGVVFALVQMLLTWAALGAGFWAPLQMIAAMLMGPDVLPPAEMTFTVFVVAGVIHMVFSIVYALAIAWIVHAMTLGPALLIGSLFGLFPIYVVNFHVLAPYLFPWLTEAQHWVSWLNHVLFGLVAAGVYITLRDRRAHHAPEL